MKQLTAEEQATTFIKALIGPFDLDAVLVFSPGFTGGLDHPAVHLDRPFDDVASDVEAILAKHRGRTHLYVGANPKSSAWADNRRNTQRGDTSDVTHLVCLVADLDHDQGEHSLTTRPHPTPAQVSRWCDDAPWDLTIVETGGGLLAVAYLDEPLDVWDAPDESSPRATALLEAWKRWWMDTAARTEYPDGSGGRGVHIDASVLADANRVIRVPGSKNMKPGYGPEGAEVRLLGTATCRYSPAEIIELCPLETPRQGLERRVPPGDRKPSNSIKDRNSDIFSAAVTPGRLLEEVEQWTPGRASRASQQFDAGLRNGHDSHATVFFTEDDSGRDTLTIFEATLIEGFRQETSNHRMSSWVILALRYCDEDWQLAGRIVDATVDGDTPDRWDTLVSALSDACQLTSPGYVDSQATSQRLREMYPPRTPSPEETEQLVDPLTDPTSSAKSARDSLLERDGSKLTVAPGSYVRDDDLLVRAHPEDSRFGLLQRRVTKVEGGGHKTWEELISSVVMIRTRSIVTMVGNEALTDRLYDVEIFAPNGHWSVPGLNEEDSLNVRRIRERSGAPIPAATTLDVQRCMSTMLSMFAAEQMEQTIEYTTTGYIQLPDGRYAYAAPGGSLSAAGPIGGITVRGPVGGDEDLTEIQAATGWPSPANTASLPAALDTIAQLYGMVRPERRHIVTALVGVAFGSILPSSRRAAAVLVGDPSIGKTMLAAAIQMFFTDADGMWGAKFSVDVTKASPTGAVNKVAWARHHLAIVDDYKQNQGRDADREATLTFCRIAQAVYGGSPESKATRNGGVRKAHSVESTALITAESLPDENEAVVQRCMVLRLKKGDVLTAGGEDDPIETFRIAALNGLPQALMGAVVVDILQGLDNQRWETGLDGLKAHVNDRRRHHQLQFGAARAGETAASAAVGWELLLDFAERHNIHGALPSQEQVAADLRTVVQASSTAHGDSDPALFISRRTETCSAAQPATSSPQAARRPTRPSPRRSAGGTEAATSTDTSQAEAMKSVPSSRPRTGNPATSSSQRGRQHTSRAKTARHHSQPSGPNPP
ncbi:MAG: hypothetical protein ACR2MB_04940 [Acidimicrobiales bacterium]